MDFIILFTMFLLQKMIERNIFAHKLVSIVLFLFSLTS